MNNLWLNNELVDRLFQYETILRLWQDARV